MVLGSISVHSTNANAIVSLSHVEYSCFNSTSLLSSITPKSKLSLSTSTNNHYSHLYVINQKHSSSFYKYKFITINTSFNHYSNNIRLSLPTSMADSIPRVSVENHENGVIDPSCTEIIVVRHGETDWNAISKLQGQLDVDLNETGRQQANLVAERLSREPNISAIYSSDLNRAFETAEIIASKCGGLEVIRDQDLRERHLGALQGHAYQEIAKLNPKAYEAFKSHRSDQEIPGGGESRDQLYRRCTSSVKRIGEKHRGQRVIVVSHGGVIRSLFIRAAVRGQHPGRISNTSVGVLQLSDGDMWSIKSWNDISHLRQTGYLESAFGGDASSG